MTDEKAENAEPYAPRTAHRMRAALRHNRTADIVYRTVVGVIGGGITILGVILMPLPGPGTVIALAGVAILGTEFAAARRLREAVTKIIHRARTTWREYRERKTPKAAAVRINTQPYS